jgi:hypothetical protein
MSEHKTQGAFLNALIRHVDNADARGLQDKLRNAIREKNCIRRAMFLMLVLLLLSVSGLGYCAVLLPDVFRNPDATLFRTLLVLVLGSLMSEAALLGCLFWHQALVGRLHKECRRFMLTVVESRLKESSTAPLTANGARHYPSVAACSPDPPTEMASR